MRLTALSVAERFPPFSRSRGGPRPPLGCGLDRADAPDVPGRFGSGWTVHYARIPRSVNRGRDDARTLSGNARCNRCACRSCRRVCVWAQSERGPPGNRQVHRRVWEAVRPRDHRWRRAEGRRARPVELRSLFPGSDRDDRPRLAAPSVPGVRARGSSLARPGSAFPGLAGPLLVPLHIAVGNETRARFPPPPFHRFEALRGLEPFLS